MLGAAGVPQGGPGGNWVKVLPMTPLISRMMWGRHERQREGNIPGLGGGVLRTADVSWVQIQPSVTKPGIQWTHTLSFPILENEHAKSDSRMFYIGLQPMVLSI